MRRGALQWIASILFIAQMYIVMALAAFAYAPWAIVNRRGAYSGVYWYCNWVRWTAAWMLGLKSEVRGTVPKGEVLIAAKHQSFFDIILIVSVVREPKFIMKSSLRFAPFLGWYAKRIGCVPVDRGKRAEAIRQMMDGVTKGTAPAGQLIIYPQGTRVAPDKRVPYKVGSAVLYTETGQTCVPAATNVGIFWPRHGIYRKPGLAVVEFLEPIAPGLSRDAFMARLETQVEERSDALMREGGFDPDAIPGNDQGT